MYHAFRENEIWCAIMQNLPEDFRFTEFKSVWSYKSAPIHKRDIQIDVFAISQPGSFSMIGEVKNRENEKFSRDEALAFKEKAATLIELETVEKPVLFVFSKAGFTREALDFFTENSIAWAVDVKWLEG